MNILLLPITRVLERASRLLKAGRTEWRLGLEDACGRVEFEEQVMYANSYETNFAKIMFTSCAHVSWCSYMYMHM